MANETKFAGLTSLRTFLDNCKNLFATKTSVEELSADVAYINVEDNENITDADIEASSVVVDSALSETSTNPVQNKVVTAEINSLSEAIADVQSMVISELLVSLLEKAIYRVDPSDHIASLRELWGLPNIIRTVTMDFVTGGISLSDGKIVRTAMTTRASTNGFVRSITPGVEYVITPGDLSNTYRIGVSAYSASSENLPPLNATAVVMSEYGAERVLDSGWQSTEEYRFIAPNSEKYAWVSLNISRIDGGNISESEYLAFEEKFVIRAV